MDLVVDANVLIDYAKTDPSVLTLYARHLGRIYVPSVILGEVEQLDETNPRYVTAVIIQRFQTEIEKRR